MTELTCAEARDSAAEFALGILPVEERAAMATHLLRCPTCRAEVESMATVGARLLDLIPGTEPPLGFDRRTLARVHSGGPGRPPTRWRRPSRRVMVAVATVAAAVFACVGWVAGRGTSRPDDQVEVTAALWQDGRTVGKVYASGGSPPWVTMTLHGVATSGPVTCELVRRSGVTRLGTFTLVSGGGTWSAADPSGLGGVTGARLVDGQGRVVATAAFS